MQRRPDEPGHRYHDPETMESLHRPPGHPQPRESQSQQAQVHSKHQHGTNKAAKTNMAKKTGLKKGSNFSRANSKDK